MQGLNSKTLEKERIQIMTDNKEYLSYAYNVDGSKSTVKGNSISELLDKWRKLESLRDDNDKIKSFYAVEKDSTGKYGEATRYDIATGKDITPVYFELPSLNKEDFERTVEQLKNDGAHFNPSKKAWYVTKDMDLSKFDKYINPKADAASKRESQVEKLENYKNEIYVTEKKANAPKQTKAKNRKNEVKKQEAVR
jgi:hypothetical protein